MIQTRAGRGALWGAILLFMSGVTAFILIVTERDPNEALGLALAPAAQTLLAAVIAAFGLTQVSIAQKAVEVTEDQNQIMRAAARAAVDEAEQRTREAAAAFSLATIERLDAFAPNVALIGTSVNFFDGSQPDVDTLGNGRVAERLVIDEVQAQSLNFRYTAVLTLENFDDSPVLWETTPQLPGESARGSLMPGERQNFYVDEIYSLAAWIEKIEDYTTQSFEERGGRGIFRRSVTVSGISNFVRDTHTVALFPPPIRRDGGHFVVEPGQPQAEPLGERARAYSSLGALSDPTDV